MDIQPREPIVFSAGDSLYFERTIPEFQPSQGWYLEYNLVSDAGQAIAQFRSSPSTDGNAHIVEIDNFQPAIDPKAGYVLVGYAVNPTGVTGQTQERHQFYSRQIRFTPNFNTAGPFDPQCLEEWEMVKLYRSSLKQLAKTYVTESDIQRVKLVREKQKEIRTELCFWEERLFNRLAQESVNNGGPNPYVIRPVFAIC